MDDIDRKIKMKMDRRINNQIPLPRTKWSQAELDVIINEVKNYPTNIDYAFEQAEMKLDGRNKKSIQNAWYLKLRKNTNVNAITTGSEKGFTKNVKNTHRDEDGNLPDQGLMHYMYVLKEILNLPQKERDVILQVFNIGNININTK